MRVSIIGGGVYGSAVAYFFERFGDEDVHLFDRGTIAEGSTEKSAAIVRQHYSNEAHLRLAKRGRDVLANFEEYVGRDGGYVENGYLLLAGEDNKTALRENVALGRGVGVDVELLAPEEISRRVPALAVDDVAVGAIERDSGFADPVAVTQGFVEAARESGTDVHTNTPVTDVETDGRRPTRIRTTDGAFETDYVVNAAGPWGAAVGSMIGLDLPLSWHESKMAELESSPPYEPDLPTVSDVDLGLYAKPETTGHFVAGGADRKRGGRRAVDPGAGLNGVDAEYLAALRDLIDRRFPGFDDVRVTGTWSGIVTVTPDWHQIVGVPKGYENFYNVLGPSGHGFKEAPGFAESVAAEILGREPPNDLSPYRLERFDSRDTFKRRYGEESRA
jgi:sarcosine oxidase subunit beta